MGLNNVFSMFTFISFRQWIQISILWTELDEESGMLPIFPNNLQNIEDKKW